MGGEKRGTVEGQSSVLMARHSGTSVQGSVLRISKLAELCGPLF